MNKMSYALIFGAILALGIVLFFSTANVSFADSFEIINPIPEITNLWELIEAITNFVFMIALILAPLMFIIAGFLFITSGAVPEKVKTARNMFLYTLIGVAVVLLARGLVVVIISILAGDY